MKDLILVDLDGTLADCEHRRHFVTPQQCTTCLGTGTVDLTLLTESCRNCSGKGTVGKIDWTAFYKACVDDKPLQTTIDLITKFAGNEYDILIVSGRSDEVREETEAWLLKHFPVFDGLLMRPEGDFTPDHELKRQWLNTRIPKDRVFCVFDDRDQVVKMWRAEGLTCYQVADGDF